MACILSKRVEETRMKNMKKLFLIMLCVFSITSMPVHALLGAAPQATESGLKSVMHGIGNNAGWVAFAATVVCLYVDRITEDWDDLSEDEDAWDPLKENWQRTKQATKTLSAITLGSIASCYLLRLIASKL